MKKVLIATLLASTLSFAQEIEKLDLSEGLGDWSTKGEIVAVDKELKVVQQGAADSELAIKIDLHPKKWSILKQKLRSRSKDKSFAVSFEIVASGDFKRAAEARTYTEGLSWGEKGSYVWSKEVYPKTDLMVRMTRKHRWHYRIWPLEKSWKTVEAELNDLDKGIEMVEIAVPPGEGFVLIKNIQ